MRVPVVHLWDVGQHLCNADCLLIMAARTVGNGLMAPDRAAPETDGTNKQIGYLKLSRHLHQYLLCGR